MSYCIVQFMGGYRIRINGEEITTIPAGKARLLVAKLILANDMAVCRKQLSFEFWPDTSEKQALTNLRKLLHDTRKCLPHPDRWFIVTPTHLQWNHAMPYNLDVLEFEQAAQGETYEELVKATEIYKGELLPGFYFDSLEAKRDLLAHLYTNVLEKIIAILESRKEISAAILFANKLLAHNRYNEDTYRTLMRLYTMKRDKANAAKVYHKLQTILEHELGIDPSKETRELFQGAVLQNK